jgi:hypothetical protein
MKYDDELDRALANEQEIAASSGFVGSVMDAVQREASAPPPIPFPWKRALPGMVVAGVAVIAVVAVMIRMVLRGRGVGMGIPPEVIAMLHTVQVSTAGWVVLALLISFVCVKIAGGLGWGESRG